MIAAGIIAEYNPFHNGHALLAERAREAGEDCIVSVMSGSFVQRGEPAMMNCEVRTRAALESGIDLVLQLPSVYAVSSAQRFARAGIAVLDGLGCVDRLVFGSESGDTEKIAAAADAVYCAEIEPLISGQLEKGISFAAARENALRELRPDTADIIKTPNDILGVEYVAALKFFGSQIKPAAFARVGAEHDSSEAHSSFASASLIRSLIKSGGDWQGFVPAKAAEIYSRAELADIGRIENAVLYKLRTASAAELSDAPDVSEGIENRILSAAKEAVSLEDLYALAKTKRYSHARIRRIVMNYFLGVTAADLEIPVPYIRVLGFNSVGAELLRAAKQTAKLPLVTKAADIADIGENAQRIFGLECTAGDIFSLCYKKSLPCGEEKRFKPIIYR